MINLLELSKVCKSLLRSFQSLFTSLQQEGSIMENEIVGMSSLTNQEKITLFIMIGFQSMMARLLYCHRTAGTDV